MDATPLTQWDNFYVIVGSSAAALTGLQFVVMALAADAPSASTGTSTATVDAFGTPNIVHFSMVLLVSAILSAPWPALLELAISLAVCGGGGVIYGIIVIRRARRQTGYKPVLEDWIWHATLPLAAYTAFTIASLLIVRLEEDALFAVAAASLLLLFIGIHNAWDTVTYLAVARIQNARQDPPDADQASR
jgi:hypothetical protein